MDIKIKALTAYQVFDSKGFPTIEGKLTLSDGRSVTTSVSNSVHQSKYAAGFLYDNEVAFGGRGVTRAIKYFNDLIAPKLVNIDPTRYKDIDLWLVKADPSESKELLGANTTLFVSQLVYKAAALLADMPLYRFFNKIYMEHFEKREIRKIPSPIFTLIAGGRHGAETLNFQEFSVVPSTGMVYSKALETIIELYHELETVFRYRNIFTGTGDDGAYIPNLSSNVDALEIIKEAILKRGLKLGLDVFFALDLAADFYYKGGKYYLSTETFDTKGFYAYLEKLFKEYRMLMIEDAFADDDSAGWRLLNDGLGERVYIMGDDMVATNKKRLEKAVKEKLCNMVNVKPTQRGTFWELFEFIAGARKSGMKICVAQSALETNDTLLADFAVGVQADFVKFGAPARGERVAKYNRLLQIEKELNG